MSFDGLFRPAPQHTAAQLGLPNIIEALIAAGFDVNKREPSRGNTPLHDAVLSRAPAACLKLLQLGADTAAISVSFP